MYAIRSYYVFEELPGYIGHNVSERERISNRQTHEQKLQAIDRWKIEQKNGSEFAKKFSRNNFV